MIRRLQLLIVARRPRRRRVLDRLPFLFYLLYLAILVDRRLVRPGPPRPVRPRGRLRGQPAARPRRRPDPGHLHAAQQRAGSRSSGSRSTTRRRCPAACPAGRSRSAAASERSWLIRAPLSRRGHFRIEPLQIRTGDPFGFFEASATVGQGVSVVVYPRLEPLPALAAAGRPASRAATPRPSGRSRRRRWRRPSGRTRRATR